MSLQTQCSERLSKIPKEAPVGILHDIDADGICSAVLLMHALKKLGYTSVSFLQDAAKRATFGNKTINAIKKNAIALLFTTDKAVDHDPVIVREAEKYSSLIVFDHHQLEHDITSWKTLLIKPQLFTKIPPSQYPSSKLVYDFFSPLVSLEEQDWLCVAGTVTDASYKTWKDFVDNVHRRHRLEIPPKIFSSILARVGQYINTAILYDRKKVKEVLHLVSERSYPDIISALQPYDDAVRKEITKWIALFSHQAEHYPDLSFHWYEIGAHYPVHSIVSTRITMESHPHETVAVVQHIGNKLALSLRRQDSKVNCIDIIHAAIAGIKNASGGGHVPAAGGQAPYAMKEKIKKQMFAYLIRDKSP